MEKQEFFWKFFILLFKNNKLIISIYIINDIFGLHLIKSKTWLKLFFILFNFLKKFIKKIKFKN